MTIYKTCSFCNIEKNIIDFPKIGKQCKFCISIKLKKYYQENKIQINKSTKLYREENKEYYKEYNKNYRNKNKNNIICQDRDLTAPKICFYCGIEKTIAEFPEKGNKCKRCTADKSNKYYYDNKEVVLKNQKGWYQKNKEVISIKNKEYQQNNKEDISKRNKEHYQKNKETIIEKTKKYYQENIDIASEKKRIYYKENKNLNVEYRKKNKEIISKKYKEYYEKNKPAISTKCKTYNKKRKATDPLFKLRFSVSNSIRGSLKRLLSSKGGKSVSQYIPYIMEELKNHLESLFSHPANLTSDNEVWMTWENWGSYKRKNWNDNDTTTWVWQLDHIIPHSMLPYTSMEDDNFKKCWALENLRPLRADINQQDGVTRIRHKVLNDSI